MIAAKPAATFWSFARAFLMTSLCSYEWRGLSLVYSASKVFYCVLTSIVCACTSPIDAGEQACVEPLDVQCTPAYSPTFDAIYSNLLSRSCGAPGTGSVCHSAQGMQGGLDLSELDRSYESLLGLGGGGVRVLPGDPACSVLIQRLESEDPMTRMPVGSAQLSLGERCVVRKWIAEGAPR